MRVLIVTPEYPPHAGGGILKYYATLAPALARLGCEVTVLVAAPTSPDFDDYADGAVRVRCVPRDLVQAHADRLAQFSAAPEFRRWLAGASAAHEVAHRVEAPDVIEATDFGFTCLPFVLDAEGPPVVVQLHGSLGQIATHEPPEPGRLLDHVLARLAEISVIGGAEGLQTYATGNAREWSARLGRSVDVCPPPLVPLSTAAGHRSASALVVGRVQSWKGPETLCRALSEVPESVVARVDWVGRDTSTGPGRSSLSDYLTKTYPDIWGARVVARGQRPFAEVQSLIMSASVVVVPSDWDVYNLTAAEAMSAGQIVVCSTGAGASDLVEHGRNGLVFPAGDSAALAVSLHEAMSLTAEQRHAMGQAAQETVKRELSPDAVAADRVAKYQKARSQQRRSIASADWLRDVFGGRSDLRVGTEFLDQIGVRDLSQYLGRRLRDGVLERVAGGSRQS